MEGGRGRVEREWRECKAGRYRGGEWGRSEGARGKWRGERCPTPLRRKMRGNPGKISSNGGLQEQEATEYHGRQEGSRGRGSLEGRGGVVLEACGTQDVWRHTSLAAVSGNGEPTVSVSVLQP